MLHMLTASGGSIARASQKGSSLEQILPHIREPDAMSTPTPLPLAQISALAEPLIPRAGLENERVHAALDALQEAVYGEAIEFSAEPTGLTARLGARCTRFVASVRSTRDLAEFSQAPARPFGSALELPARRYDLIVFTDVFSTADGEEADRLAAYALATLAQGGHVLILNWTEQADEPTPADIAAEKFFSRIGDEMAPLLRRRMPHFRLDLLERL
jgi:hypothetical protein